MIKNKELEKENKILIEEIVTYRKDIREGRKP